MKNLSKDLKIFNDSYFKEWIKSIKQRIKQSQLKAAVRVNTELLLLYWDIGKDIVQRDIESKWGSKIYSTLSDELKDALQKAISNKEIGIILLTEKFGREFPSIIDDVKLHHKTPLIIEIPDRHGTGRKPDFITSYVNEAIGLKL